MGGPAHNVLLLANVFVLHPHLGNLIQYLLKELLLSLANHVQILKLIVVPEQYPNILADYVPKKDRLISSYREG